MADPHKNFSYSTVATAPSPATSGTSLVVASGEGARFPDVPFNATIWPATGAATPANAEIVRVTARSTDTLTIVRAQESTTARTVVVGDRIIASITARTLTESEESVEVSITQASHGFVVGDVVRHNGSSYVKAQADTSTNSEAVGIVSVVVTSGIFRMVVSGLVSGLSGLTAGSAYFLSAATAGALTAVEPSSVGQISKPLLLATSTTAGYFINFRGMLIETGESSQSVSSVITQASHGFVVGDVVRHSGTIYTKAQADSAANAEVVGIVSSVADANNFVLVGGGRVTGLTGLTAGTTYYLSAATAGLLTETEPSGGSNVSKPLLTAVSTTEGYFFNMRGAVLGEEEELVFGAVELVGGDLTGLASTTFADVTGAAVTLSTGARRCCVSCVVEVEGQSVGQDVFLDLAVDGTRVGGTNGLTRTETYSGSRMPMGFSYVTDVLTAGSHTFKLQYRVDSSTLTVFAGSAQPLILQVHEIADSASGDGGGNDGLVLLHDQTLAADTASFDVQNIPSGYKHLRVVLQGRGTTAATAVATLWRFNNDSGANYDVIRNAESGSGYSAGNDNDATSMNLCDVSAASAPSNAPGHLDVLIPNYAGAFYKTLTGQGFFVTGTGSWSFRGFAAVWSSTSAINRVTITPNAGNFLAGSRLTIYGMKGATPSASEPDPIRDLFGSPSTAFEFDSSSLAGLTALSNTPDVVNADTTVPGHLFLRDDAAGNTASGRYATSPATPFTAIALVKTPIRSSDGAAGLFVGTSTPGAIAFWGPHVSAGVRTLAYLGYSNPTTVTSGTIATNYPPAPNWMAFVVNSTTDVDYLYSFDGLVWNKYLDAQNPGFTIGSIGLMINSGGVLTTAAFDYLRVWNSALTFPGVP